MYGEKGKKEAKKKNKQERREEDPSSSAFRGSGVRVRALDARGARCEHFREHSYAAVAAERGTAELNLNSQLPPAGGMDVASHLERRSALASRVIAASRSENGVSSSRPGEHRFIYR